MEHLAKFTGVTALDVRPALRTEKLNRQLYYRTDTHWNVYGGFFAYRELRNVLAKDYPQLPMADLDDYEQGTEPAHDYDLARIAGVDHFVKEVGPTIREKRGPKTEFEDGNRGSEINASILVSQINSRNTAGTIPRLTMLRDSFAVAMLPFLGPNIKEGTYLLTAQLTPEIIKLHKPSVVIFEVVERHLYWLRPPREI